MSTIRFRLTVTVVAITAVLAGLALWVGVAVLEANVIDTAVQDRIADFADLDTTTLDDTIDSGVTFEDLDDLDDLDDIDDIDVFGDGVFATDAAFVIDALEDASESGLADELFDGLADENGLLQIIAFDGTVVGVSEDLSVIEVADVDDFADDDVLVPQQDIIELQFSLFEQFDESTTVEDASLDELAEGRELRTAVAETLGPDLGVIVDVTDELLTIETLSAALWTAAGLVVVLAGLATWFLTGRALRPVGAITAQVEEISGGTLDERVPEPDTNDEIGVLAHTMNRMLGRLEDSDKRQRRFVSDASHELRTPVSVLRSEAEVALKAPGSTSIEALATVVRGEAGRLGGMIEDLLLLARSDEGTRPPADSMTEVDLDDIVYAEAARTRRVPVDRSGVSAARLRGRPEDLGRAIAHLLDNAARHAESQVVVTARADGGVVSLIVDDDGAGVPDAERHRIFERFVRLDDARTRDRGGSGLGLAVVAEIVAGHGGTIEVSDSPLGGARFEVNLPE